MGTRWPAPFVRVTVTAYAVNLAAILASVASGLRKGNLAARFEEKEAITIISSNQLAMTALLAALIYLVRRQALGAPAKWANFWLLSSLAFFFLMLDESFQFHEGVDSRLFEAFGAGTENPRVDGLSTALYGLGAAIVCWAFRADILRFRPTVVLFGVGAAFLAATSALNFGHAPAWRVVTEEAAKLLGVCSFLLGYLAAFLGTVSEARERLAVRPAPALPANDRQREGEAAPLHAH